MTVRISAVICTRNRAELLRGALGSLQRQSLDKSLYEVLVVDNGSEDHTRQVAHEMANGTDIRYVYEPVPGLSRARNAGLDNVRGDYVAFLDDDALAAPDWMEKFLAAFEESSPDVACIGGWVEVVLPEPQPKWLPDGMLTIFGIPDYPYASPQMMKPDEWLSMCNLGYPVWALRKVGGLREDLGRKGKTLLAHEDQDLRKKHDALGLKTVYHPELVVQHLIPSSRLTKAWFRSKSYWQGISAARLASPDGRFTPAQRIGLSLRQVRWLAPRLAKMLVSRKPDERFKRQCQLYETYGYLNSMINYELPEQTE